MMQGFEDFTLDNPITDGLILSREGERGGLGNVRTNIPHLVVSHSPSGFEFGYGGSGPADLALNALEILLTRKGYKGQRVDCFEGTCWDKAYELHQEFKRDFIANAPDGGCVIPYETLMVWIDKKLKGG